MSCSETNADNNISSSQNKTDLHNLKHVVSGHLFGFNAINWLLFMDDKYIGLQEQVQKIKDSHFFDKFDTLLQ